MINILLDDSFYSCYICLDLFSIRSMYTYLLWTESTTWHVIENILPIFCQLMNNNMEKTPICCYQFCCCQEGYNTLYILHMMALNHITCSESTWTRDRRIRKSEAVLWFDSLWTEDILYRSKQYMLPRVIIDELAVLVSLLVNWLIDHEMFKGGATRSSTSAPQIGLICMWIQLHQAALWDDLNSQPELQLRTKSINGRNQSVTAWWSRFGYLRRSTKVTNSVASREDEERQPVVMSSS